jgi:orotate phosphoribosyltransferase-like protein
MAAISELRDQGLTFEQIGERLGISRQRVHQIVSRRDDGMSYEQPYKNTYRVRRYHQEHPNAVYYKKGAA